MISPPLSAIDLLCICVSKFLSDPARSTMRRHPPSCGSFGSFGSFGSSGSASRKWSSRMQWDREDAAFRSVHSEERQAKAAAMASDSASALRHTTCRAPRTCTFPSSPVRHFTLRVCNCSKRVFPTDWHSVIRWSRRHGPHFRPGLGLPAGRRRPRGHPACQPSRSSTSPRWCLVRLSLIPSSLEPKSVHCRFPGPVRTCSLVVSQQRSNETK